MQQCGWPTACRSQCSLPADGQTHTHTHAYVWQAVDEAEEEAAAAAHPQHVVRINDISHEHFARATDNSRSSNNNENGNSRNNKNNNTAHKESETVSCLSCPIVQVVQVVQVVQLSSLQGMSVSAFRSLVFCPTSSIALIALSRPVALSSRFPSHRSGYELRSLLTRLALTRLASLQLGAPSNHKSIKVVRFAVLRAESHSQSPTLSPGPTLSRSLSPSPTPSLGLSAGRLTSL